MKKQKTMESDFVDFIVEVNKSFGIDSLSSKLIATIYLSPEEISMEDLSLKTGYSLASISNKMKMIEASGQVRRMKKPGSKKIYYYMDKEISRLMRQHIEKNHKEVILPALDFLPGLIKKHEAVSGEEKERLKIIKNYYKQMENLNKIWEKITEILEKCE